MRMRRTAMNKKLRIRNSTAEFLTFVSQNEGNSIEVRFEENTLWLTQQLIAELFGTTKQNVSLHIQNIISDGELAADATVKDFLTVRQEGDRQVSRTLEYYNLDMIIAVGYRVNSKRATEYRHPAGLCDPGVCDRPQADGKRNFSQRGLF